MPRLRHICSLVAQDGAFLTLIVTTSLTMPEP